jgi:hypothetical protein
MQIKRFDKSAKRLEDVQQLQTRKLNLQIQRCETTFEKSKATGTVLETECYIRSKLRLFNTSCKHLTWSSNRSTVKWETYLFLDIQHARNGMDWHRHCLASVQTHTDKTLSVSTRFCVSRAIARSLHRPHVEILYDQPPNKPQIHHES